MKILSEIFKTAITIVAFFAGMLAVSCLIRGQTPPTGTTVATTAPATFATGTGAGFGVRTVYTAGPAPLVGWVDARNVSATRTDRVAWNFGDGNELYTNPQHGVTSTTQPATVGANDSLTGQIAGHWFEYPGTYHVTCSVTHPSGGRSSYTATVVVGPDTRKQVYFAATGADTNAGTAASPYKSAAKLAAVLTAGNVNVHLGHNWTGTLPGTVTPGSWTVVQGDGSPLIVPAVGCPAFAGAGNGTTAHVLVWGVQFSSPSTADGCHVATATGTDWAFVDCTIGTLNRGLYGHGIDGLLIQGVKQPVADSVASQVVYVDSATHLAVVFCDLTGSLDESTARFDVETNTPTTCTGGAAGVSIEHNLIAQPAQAKAALTFRGGQDVVSAANVFQNADESWNVGDGDATASIGSARVTNVASWGDTIVTGGNPATFRISPGVIGLTATGLDFHGTAAQPAVTVSPNYSAPATLTGVVLKVSTFTGGKSVVINGASPVASPASTTVTGAAAGGVTTQPASGYSGVVIQ